MKFTAIAVLLFAATSVALPRDDDDMMFPFDEEPVRGPNGGPERVGMQKGGRYQAKEDFSFSSHNKGYEVMDKRDGRYPVNEDLTFSSHNKGYEGMDKRDGRHGVNEDLAFSTHNKGYEGMDKRNSHYRVNEDHSFSSHGKGYEGEQERDVKGGWTRGGKVPPQ
ncbi:hypothetical protein B0T16DRAFT_388522 [Cercophora newfieldiana]|uniref:Uncharacterized protein n=1 Tax=Cercophora newfieldiana TaxID=92897 RepID=A0AA39Y8Z7_9PEZI|nr:hypothetical protein B0T16DRAFT_388522 [Cercophora newfieldiana]